jgi:hypothetical protein
MTKIDKGQRQIADAARQDRPPFPAVLTRTAPRLAHATGRTLSRVDRVTVCCQTMIPVRVTVFRAIVMRSTTPECRCLATSDVSST